MKISEFNANNVDPDQTPRSAASNLGLHCLLMLLLWDARLIWVNNTTEDAQEMSQARNTDFTSHKRCEGEMRNK